MSTLLVSSTVHPPHGHLENTTTAPTQTTGKPATLHPCASKPDPTLSSNASQRGLSAATTAGSAELSSLMIRLRQALRQFPDFPSPGVLFEDILPIFADPSLHEALL